MGDQHFTVRVIQDEQQVFKGTVFIPETRPQADVTVAPGSLAGYWKPFSILIEKMDPETKEAESGESPIGE